MTTYPISPDVAKRAAADYLAIVRAGMVWELEREIQQTIEAHNHLPERPTGHDWDAYEARRLDQFLGCDGFHLREPHRHAGRLASMLQCPASAVAGYVVPELLDGNAKRTLVLDCLRNMANYARKEMAMGRRSA
jgi:hypothetical protein